MSALAKLSDPPGPCGTSSENQLVLLQMALIAAILPFRYADSAPQQFRGPTSTLMSFNAFLRAWLLPSLAFNEEKRRTTSDTNRRFKNLNEQSGLFPSRLVTFSPQVCVTFISDPLFGVSLPPVTVIHRPSD